MLLFLLLNACLYDRERFLELSDGFVDDDGDGFREVDRDCDDSDKNVNPSILEVCDGIDNDCDGVADGEGAADISAWYQDLDGDTYGIDAVKKLACERPDLFVERGGDCDDADPTKHPNALERCEDGLDKDCDGIAPHDADGDGFLCDDCDNSDPEIYPQAPERCNDLDDDCDAQIDDYPADPPSWYDDADGDGFGDPSTEVRSCDAPSGYISDGTDCNDSTADAAPGLPELCLDGLDTNCDGLPGECESGGALQPLAVLGGTAAGDYLGQNVAGLGDVNGDGYDDIAVSSSWAEIRAQNIFGPFSGNISINLVSVLKLEGEDNLGAALAGAGDQDGDGFSDLLVASCSGDYSGEVYLVGSRWAGRLAVGAIASAQITGPSPGTCGGYGLWGNFDRSQDGQGDVAVGAPYGSVGEIGFFHGPLSGSLAFSDAALRLTGEQNGDLMGLSLVTEDLDGSGLPDVVVGAHYLEEGGHRTGKVYLLSDPGDGSLSVADADRSWWGVGDAQVGYPLVGTQDEAGDGYGDLWVGASDDLTGQGSGSMYRLSSNMPGGRLIDRASVLVLGGGSCCFDAIVEDFNIDGTDDLVIGSMLQSGNSQGYVALFYGPLAGTVDYTAADAWYMGEDSVGYSLAFAGDTDGDGNREILAGAPYADANAGAAVLLEIEVW
jgi:Putative metal-binding motif/FG-GAP repeat